MYVIALTKSTVAVRMDATVLFAALFPFAPLMPCASQQFAVLVFAHLLSSLFDNATQPITSHVVKCAGTDPAVFA